MNLAFLQDGQISLFLQVQIYRTSPSTRVPLCFAMLRTIGDSCSKHSREKLVMSRRRKEEERIALKVAVQASVC
jgi:hypothetical protein